MLRAKIENDNANRNFPSSTGSQGGRLVQVGVTLGWWPRAPAWPRAKRVFYALMIVVVPLAIYWSGDWLQRNPTPPSALPTYLLRMVGSWDWWARVFAALLFIFTLTQLVRRRRLDPIWVFILPPDAPFPIPEVPYAERERHIFAVRIIGSNLDKRLDLPEPIEISLREPPDPPDVANVSEILTAMRRTRKRQREAAENFWPLIRVAVDRTLFRSRHEESSRKLERIPKHPWYFMYMIHLPQIAGILLLIAISLILFTVLDGAARKYCAIALSGAAVMWGLTSIQLHRRQYRQLLRWAQTWAETPFTDNPVFYYQRDGEPGQRWEELMEVDFTARIQEFGLDNHKLLEALVVFLVLGFIEMLHVLK